MSEMNKHTANDIFYSSLYNQLSILENEVVNPNNANSLDTEFCLITNEAIEHKDNKVKLLCGHIFKYEAILNSVNHNRYKSTKNKVYMKNNQLQCPYCRNIQNGLLPHFKPYNRIKYVNSPDKYVMKINKCKYIFKTGKRKGNTCGLGCYDKYCKKCVLKKKKTNLIMKDKDKYQYCKDVLKTGKRKGEACGRICKNGYKCGIHTKNLTKNLTKE